MRGQRPSEQKRRRYPLLVVAAGASPADDSALGEVTEDLPAGAGVALAKWRGRHANLSAPARWFVVFRLSAPGSEQTEEQARRKQKTQAAIQQEIANLPLPRVRRPWPTYLGGTLAALCLVAGMIAVPLVNHHECRLLLSVPALHAGMTREPGDGQDQCVGILPADARLPVELADVVKKINQNNKVAAGNPRHLTVIHFSSLTPADAQGLRVAREELRGLAVAQKETLSDQYPIRLLLANAGNGMKYAEVAAQKIRYLARRDKRIMGVVSLGLSTQQTADAIALLGNAGVVTVGSATTADRLVSASSSYFQVSPNNRREAEVAADYAARRGYRSVRIFYSGDAHDIYSSDLAKYMKAAFAGRGIAVRAAEPYQTDPDGPGTVANLLGPSACAANKSAHELVVYAGRAERFNAFLNGISLSCQGHYPQILADDDVSRFVLAGENKAYPHLKLDYLALASSALWGKNCVEVRNNYSFFALYEQLFGGACDENKDGRALLNYDALTVLKIAVLNALQTGSRFPPPSNAIVSGLNSIRDENKVTAASGDIDFGGPEPRVPANKTILILRTTADQPCLVETTGKLSKQPHISGDCSAASNE
jgi:ABC-type branched-subunit amino acid transport system substrate-binding protein